MSPGLKILQKFVELDIWYVWTPFDQLTFEFRHKDLLKHHVFKVWEDNSLFLTLLQVYFHVNVVTRTPKFYICLKPKSKAVGGFKKKKQNWPLPFFL